MDKNIGRRGNGREDERESGISSRHKWLVEPEYFHVLLCESEIYLDQTRGDCKSASSHDILQNLFCLFATLRACETQPNSLLSTHLSYITNSPFN